MLFKRKNNEIKGNEFEGEINREDLTPEFVVPDKPVIHSPAYIKKIKDWCNGLLYKINEEKNARREVENRAYSSSIKIRTLEKANGESHNKYIEIRGLYEDAKNKLNLVLEELKAKSDNEKSFKAGLIEERNKFISEFKQKHESEINQLRQENSSLKENNSQVTKQKENIGYQYSNVEEDYRTFIINKHLGGKLEKYGKKELIYLKDLVEEKEGLEKSKSLQGTSSKGGGVLDLISPPNLDSVNLLDLYSLDLEDENYLAGNGCYCHNEKGNSAKSCEEHRRKAKSLSVSRAISMPEAHKIVFEDYKESMQ